MGVVVSSVGLLKFYRLANCLCCTGPSVFSTDLEKESVLLASTAGFWLALLSVGLTGQRSWNDSKKPFQLRTTTELLRKKIQQDAPLEAFINGSRIWMVMSGPSSLDLLQEGWQPAVQQCLQEAVSDPCHLLPWPVPRWHCEVPSFLASGIRSITMHCQEECFLVPWCALDPQPAIALTH